MNAAAEDYLPRNFVEAERVVDLSLQEAEDAQENADLHVRLQDQVDTLAKLEADLKAARGEATETPQNPPPSQEKMAASGAATLGDRGVAQIAQALLSEENRELHEELARRKSALPPPTHEKAAALLSQGAAVSGGASAATEQAKAQGKLTWLLQVGMVVVAAAMLAVGCWGGHLQKERSSKGELRAAYGLPGRYGSFQDSAATRQQPRQAQAYRVPAGVVDEEEADEEQEQVDWRQPPAEELHFAPPRRVWAQTR